MICVFFYSLFEILSSNKKIKKIIFRSFTEVIQRINKKKNYPRGKKVFGVIDSLKFSNKSSTSEDLINHFDSAAKKYISKFNLNKKSNIIDIGSNDGTLLKSFKRRGF